MTTHSDESHTYIYLILNILYRLDADIVQVVRRDLKREEFTALLICSVQTLKLTTQAGESGCSSQ